MDRRSCIAGTALFAAAPWARARGFPTRPVRVISPYAAGGGPDVLLRQAGPALGDALGRPVLVESKVGAAGATAARYVARQPADGHTCLLGSNTHLVQKMLQPSLAFDPLADFAPVSSLALAPAVLVVDARLPWRSAVRLFSTLRSQPRAFSYGSGGIGTSAHLAGATIAALAGLQVAHIPLRGSVEIAPSLRRGDIAYACPVAGTALPQVLGGKLRALAVTSRARLPRLPGVPTLQEVLQDELAVQESWFGLWAPAGTGRAALDALNAAARQAVADPAVRDAYAAAGNVAVASPSAAAFAEFVRGERRHWAMVVQRARLAPNG